MIFLFETVNHLRKRKVQKDFSLYKFVGEIYEFWEFRSNVGGSGSGASCLLMDLEIHILWNLQTDGSNGVIFIPVMFIFVSFSCFCNFWYTQKKRKKETSSLVRRDISPRARFFYSQFWTRFCSRAESLMKNQ